MSLLDEQHVCKVGPTQIVPLGIFAIFRHNTRPDLEKCAEHGARPGPSMLVGGEHEMLNRGWSRWRTR